MAVPHFDVNNILQLFDLSDLKGITKSFVEQFSNGVNGVKPGLDMLPTFVTVPNGTETGTFLTLDFEANEFRVSQVELLGQRKFKHIFEIFEISERLKHGKVNEFVDKVAEGIAQFLERKKIVPGPNVTLPLGVTFGFPLKKMSLRHATLAGWAKGFNLQDGVGQDILELIRAALDKRGLHQVRCVAIANDTVSTMLSQAYCSGTCVLAAIFGLGTNGVVVEPTRELASLRTQVRGLPDSMLVNTEWGSFNSPAIPTTSFDNKLQRESLQPRTQSFEKMVSWRYLGEIVRNVILSLVDNSPPLLFKGYSTPALNSRFGFDTYFVKLVEEAQTPDKIRAVLVEHLEFKPAAISDGDADVVRRICEQVITRSAKLAACAIAAALVHKGHASLEGSVRTKGETAVALSGELPLLHPPFLSRLRAAMSTVIGPETEKKVTFHLVPDSGAVGAALIAFQGEKTGN